MKKLRLFALNFTSKIRTKNSNDYSSTSTHFSVVKEINKIKEIKIDGKKGDKNKLLIQSVSHSYDFISCFSGPSFVLQNINFFAETGELITILGENGAGKTTLINFQ